MREIKFRAWDKIKKEMIFDGIEFHLRCIEITATELHKSTIIGFNNWFEGDRFNIMQFTGLKDNLGKEIYEGDILKKHYGSTIPYIIVAYHTERAAFINNDGYNSLLFHEPLHLCEIIGNIHQNPKLIK